MFDKEIITPEGEEDVLLPEGYAEGDDLFAPPEGDRDEAPTPEPEPVSGDTGGDEGAPTPEQTQTAPHRLKFKARIDRSDVDVELDESQLPTLYQKAQVVDRVQARLAKQAPLLEQAEEMSRAMGYHNLEEMLGSHSVQAHGRDFTAEAAELVKVRPDLAGQTVPERVVRACLSENKPLLVAYTEYEAAQHKAEADRLRRENQIMQQNQAAADRAPVRGVRGGGDTGTRPEDDFLRGFNADD